MKEDNPKIWFYDTEIKEFSKKGEGDTVFNMTVESNPLIHDIYYRDMFYDFKNRKSVLNGHNAMNIKLYHYIIKYI